MRRWKILVVDDEPNNLQVIRQILKNEYELLFAKDGLKAIELANQYRPDLALLDIMMPDMDGYEVCRLLKANPGTAQIPVIFVTALNDVSDEEEGFNVGAVDYLSKPVSPAIVKARVRTHLSLYDQNRVLEKAVRARTRQLSMVQDATIFSLSTLAEYRDNETGGHILRTQGYVRALAQRLYDESAYSDQISEEIIDLLFKSAPLHDIGKVGVPDALLLKPGKLTPDEFEEMKKHTTYGYEALKKAEEHMGGEEAASFLRYAKEIAHTHQEKWDGSGYPQALSGQNIPLSGRIMALADVYDALISKRVYKPPFPHSKAMTIIKEGEGTHFDPVILNAFLEIEQEFIDIALKNLDCDEERETLLS